MSAAKSVKQAVVVALVALVYSIGTMGVFTSFYTDYHRQVFQQQVRVAEKENLEKMVFTEHDYKSLHWTEQGREFELGGKMYDVSSVTKAEEGYVVLCENDKLEEAMLAFIKSTHKTAGHGNLKKGSPQPLFFNSLVQISPIPGPQANTHLITCNAEFYCSLHQETSSPPPRW